MIYLQTILFVKSSDILDKSIIIGTRGSKLALWQANHTKDLLAEIGVASTLKIIKTQGDRVQNLSFDKLEGKGFFTKEIEDELLAETIDIAVHSLKDMPTTQPEGLILTALLRRENPADWLVISQSSIDSGKDLSLKANPVIGTSSARRKAQILSFRSDAVIKDIRGNVPTRLRKLEEGQFDAILLAAAGLIRLDIDLSNFKVIKFHPREFIPAPGQGVVAIQSRVGDLSIRRMLKSLHQKDVGICTNVERGVLKMMDGGCHLPLGVYCEIDQQRNFLVHASFAHSMEEPLQNVRLTSSTYAGLADQVYQALER